MKIVAQKKMKMTVKFKASIVNIQCNKDYFINIFSKFLVITFFAL